MPFKKCCVLHCKPANIRHVFPNPRKDLERFRSWLQHINSIELNAMDPLLVYHKKRICHNHFESCYISTRSNRLHRSAVPTLYLNNEINFIPIMNRSSVVPLFSYGKAIKKKLNETTENSSDENKENIEIEILESDTYEDLHIPSETNLLSDENEENIDIVKLENDSYEDLHIQSETNLSFDENKDNIDMVKLESHSYEDLHIPSETNLSSDENIDIVKLESDSYEDFHIPSETNLSFDENKENIDMGILESDSYEDLHIPNLSKSS